MSKTYIETRPPATLLRRIALNGPTMGSRWCATFYAAEETDPEDIGASLQAAVDNVDRQMSTWRPDSDVNRLNDAPVGGWVEIPRELARVLAEALAIGRASGGAFDIGVGDLVRAWGFGGGARSPDPAEIAAFGGRSSFDPPRTLQLGLATCRARKLAPLTLDLSGIAKGFGVDELAGVLEARGVTSFLVGINGELRAAGAKPNGRPWVVAHEKPEPGIRDLAGILELSDCAVATSGRYRHRAEVNGRLVSHTMDPATGAPLANDLAAVTVLAGSCMAADAWATALLVSGATRGPALAKTAGLAALFVRSDGEVLSTLP